MNGQSNTVPNSQNNIPDEGNKEKKKPGDLVSVEDYQALMDCIGYNTQPKPGEGNQGDLPEESPKINTHFEGIEIEITNYNFHYRHNRSLYLSLENA